MIHIHLVKAQAPISILPTTLEGNAFPESVLSILEFVLILCDLQLACICENEQW